MPRLPGTSRAATAAPGAVIHLAGRRRRGPDREGAAAAQLGGSLPSEAEVEFAITMQSLFRLRGHTLTDPRTAEVYRATLEAVRLIVDGALHTGGLGPEQHATLTGMLAGAERVPTAL